MPYKENSFLSSSVNVCKMMRHSEHRASNDKHCRSGAENPPKRLYHEVQYHKGQCRELAGVHEKKRNKTYTDVNLLLVRKHYGWKVRTMRRRREKSGRRKRGGGRCVDQRRGRRWRRAEGNGDLGQVAATLSDETMERPYQSVMYKNPLFGISRRSSVIPCDQLVTSLSLHSLCCL